MSKLKFSVEPQTCSLIFDLDEDGTIHLTYVVEKDTGIEDKILFEGTPEDFLKTFVQASEELTKIVTSLSEDKRDPQLMEKMVTFLMLSGGISMLDAALGAEEKKLLGDDYEDGALLLEDDDECMGGCSSGGTCTCGLKPGDLSIVEEDDLDLEDCQEDCKL